MEHVTIRTKDQSDDGAAPGENGESLDAINVQGGGHLTLTDVRVDVGKSGNGIQGATGLDAAPSMCNGAIDCSDGAKGTGGSDAPPIVAGSFGDDGYVVAKGLDGSLGGPGHTEP